MSHRVLVLCGLALLTGCIDPPLKVSEADQLGVGLERVSSRRVGASFVRPGASLAAYTHVRISLDGIEYRSTPRDVTPDPRFDDDGNYALDADQEALLKKAFHKAFERALIHSRDYEAADAPAPDVLDVRGRIVDLVVDVSPNVDPDMTVIAKQAGEMTMVMDAVDSQSGEVLVRIADRRVISPSGGNSVYVSNAVSNSAEVRENFKRWAGILRDRLEELRKSGDATGG